MAIGLFQFEAITQLRIINLLIDGTGLHQLPMSSFGGDAALIDHDDLIGLQDRADALCHDQAGVLTLEGFTSPPGSLPVNVSGGSLGMGNLLDANGLAKAYEIVLQLRGEAGPRQVEDVNTGLAQSWRGVPTNSGAVLILTN